MWTCPDCHRKFKHENQWHSCVRQKPDDRFLNKAASVKKTYDKLLAEVRKFGPVNISTTLNSIMLKNESTFLALKPKKETLDIEFLLAEEIDDLPIYKTFRISKNRVAHSVRLESPKGITKQLLGWLREAYSLTK